MRKIITKAFKKIGRAINTDAPINDLKVELQRRATLSSSLYIEEKMLHLKSCTTNFDVLSQALAQVKIDGLYLEFGVFQGETINHISKTVPSKNVYGFDSFEGLPEFWRDGYDKGVFEVAGLPKVNKNVQLIKGWFDSTLPDFIQKNANQVAFLHVDCDLYSSTKTILDVLSQYIKPGTVIVFDEYFNYPGWKDGEFKAFQEFVKQHNVSYEYITYNRKHEQVALIIKSILAN